jgi:hypothetical protein
MQIAFIRKSTVTIVVQNAPEFLFIYPLDMHLTESQRCLPRPTQDAANPLVGGEGCTAPLPRSVSLSATFPVIF